MESDPKLAPWGLPSPASHTGCKHPLLVTAKWLPHHHGALINIFCPTLLGALLNPPLPRVCQPFFLDWFHLFNDGCANDPSYAADCVIDTRTCQEWGLDGDLEREGQVLLKRAGWSVCVCVWQRNAEELVFVFPKQTRTLDAEWKLEITPWRNFYTVAQMKRDLSTSHYSLMTVSSAEVDISFLKPLCDSCEECQGYAKHTIWAFWLFL